MLKSSRGLFRQGSAPRCWCEDSPLGLEYHEQNFVEINLKGWRARLLPGMVQVAKKAENCKVNVVCDALILDEDSRSDTYPTMEIANPSCRSEHEASVSKVSDDQVFYLMARGHSEEEAWP
ncbi:MAG: hypothetical protein Ct9H90mP16_10310 [Candidatus Poseidoniales archaeon]|nr:MAG: hypothetical protein Ct9H90mP16_10310 [Candidatus Poseidoniales archaeon]